ncbi:GNAT family N-acetyltransferase [Thermodesulfobacteriota bacterium]
MCSDHLNLILAKGFEKGILSAIFTFLNENLMLWDVLRLTDIPYESKFLEVLPLVMNNKYKVHNHYTVCPYIDLGSNWEEILASFDSKIKNIIKRKGKKFSKLEKSSFYEADLKNDFKKNISEFMRLSKLRFSMKNMISPFIDKKFINFHINIIREHAKERKARIYFLMAEGKVIAGIYLLYHNGVVYYYQSGFDPAWDRISPGTLLFNYSIENEWKEGMSEFDFLRGDESYKSLWTKHKRINVSVTIFRSYWILLYYSCLNFVKKLSNRINMISQKMVTYVKSKRIYLLGRQIYQLYL